MVSNIFKFIIIILVILFFSFVFFNYISEKNLALIKKNRNKMQNENYKYVLELPILSNNTNNVIEFNTGFEEHNKNNYKRNFWELFK